MAGPTPVLKAMLVCDQTIRDELTHKVSVIGIFDKIIAPTFPVRHPMLTVYARITDAEGEYNFRLEFINLENNQKLGEGTETAEVGDRMVMHDLIFHLHGLQFESPGSYEFRLFADSQFVGHYSFQVMQAS